MKIVKEIRENKKGKQKIKNQDKFGSFFKKVF